MDPMEIRNLQEADASPWWELRLRALSEEPQAFGKSAEEHQAMPAEVTAARFRETSPANFTLGAFEGKLLVGMATFVRNVGLKERHKGHIYAVYVAPEYRNRGLGKKLLATLIERAATNESLELILLAVSASQSSARTLYGHLGFETYGIEPRALKVGDHYVDEELMILHLR
jgi:ribosomal protein S18 acetylase RimI-like enzyme